MGRRPITNPLEYLHIFRRRWLWLLLPLVLIAAVTVEVGRLLPKLYTSEALILVEPQKVPADFVKPTVSSNVALRLESIQEQILSRTQLSELINKYALYQGQKLTPDQKVSTMLEHITVAPKVTEPDRPNAMVTAFSISFDASTPLLAQEVTRDLSNLFISENLKARADQSQGTERFIDSQLDLAQQTLTGLETQLRELRSQYMGSLPEQQDANLQVMSQLNSELQANAEGLARAQQQRTYLTSLGQAVASLGSPAAAVGPGGKPPETADEQALDKAKADLAVARQLYTPQHPDVIRLEAQVRALTQQVAAEKAAQQKADQEAAAQQAAADKKAAGPGKAQQAELAALPPQQRSQVALLDQEITQRQGDQKKIQAKINALEARIERLPEVEQKLSNITNATTQAKTNYNSLLEKKAAAATAAAMEQQAEGEEFRIIDPANLPQKPTSPDLLRIDLLGGLGGLLVGAGLAFLAEMRDPVVRTEADITFYTQAPLLAALPLLPAALALPAAPEAALTSEPVLKV